MSTRDDLENVKLEMSLVIVVRILEAKLQDVRRGILIVKMSTKDDLENVELGMSIVIFSVPTFWTADALPTDEQLKHFEKDATTAVAAVRPMAGIPSDPQIPSANLKFDVNKDEIISRFSEFCGHRASIKICGACRVGDVMAAGESYQLPLTHNRVAILECREELLQQLIQIRRDSM